MHHKKFYLYTLPLLFFTYTTIFSTTYWNWHAIDVYNIHFPASFEWGTTTLENALNGYARTSTRHVWENHHQDDQSLNKKNHKTSLLETYKEDVQLMKDMGLTTHCFSLDWSIIEPEQGYFDADVIQKYSNFCDELVDNGISPIVVLKNDSDPLWFGYLGGFEADKNICLFERYCLKMHKALGATVRRWVTFWAPDSYAMLSYLTGTTPPKVKNLHRAATVLKNIFEAHVRVYKMIKDLPNGNTTKIGIVKHIHMLEPWYLWDYPSCYAAHMLTDKAFYAFFTTGTYSLKIPLPGSLGAWVTHTNEYAPKSLDFIGINYYSHGYIKNIINHVSNPNEIATEMPGMTIYPEGLYEAIKQVATNIAKTLNIPMIITQNGIATHDENKRDLYLKRHIYALSKAIKDGFNVQGYCYYSLFDGISFESQKNPFGLFSTNKTDLTKTAKSGSRYYWNVIQKVHPH